MSFPLKNKRHLLQKVPQRTVMLYKMISRLIASNPRMDFLGNSRSLHIQLTSAGKHRAKRKASNCEENDGSRSFSGCRCAETWSFPRSRYVVCVSSCPATMRNVVFCVFRQALTSLYGDSAGICAPKRSAAFLGAKTRRVYCGAVGCDVPRRGRPRTSWEELCRES